MLYTVENESNVVAVFDVKSFPSWIDGFGVVESEEYLRYVVEELIGFKLNKVLHNDVITSRETGGHDYNSDIIATVLRFGYRDEASVFVHNDGGDETTFVLNEKEGDDYAAVILNMVDREASTISTSTKLIGNIDKHISTAFDLIDVASNDDTDEEEFVALFALLSLFIGE